MSNPRPRPHGRCSAVELRPHSGPAILCFARGTAIHCQRCWAADPLMKLWNPSVRRLLLPARAGSRPFRTKYRARLSGLPELNNLFARLLRAGGRRWIRTILLGVRCFASNANMITGGEKTHRKRGENLSFARPHAPSASAVSARPGRVCRSLPDERRRVGTSCMLITKRNLLSFFVDCRRSSGRLTMASRDPPAASARQA